MGRDCDALDPRETETPPSPTEDRDPVRIAPSTGAPEAMHAFRCPITLEVMEDPAVAADGFSYERAAIVRWIEVGATAHAPGARAPGVTMRKACTVCRSPVTGLPLSSARVLSNRALKMAISEWHETEASVPLDTSPSPEGRWSSASWLDWEWGTAWSTSKSTCMASHVIVLSAAALVCWDVPILYDWCTEIGWRLCAAIASLTEHWSATSSTGPLLLTAGIGLCATGLVVDDEPKALLLVAVGAPLAVTSFCIGLVCAHGGVNAVTCAHNNVSMSMSMSMCATCVRL